MPRAIWSGSISFGLISLPVKAYSATSRQRIEFDLLHDEDNSRIEYKRFSKSTGKEVDWDHIIKGYELSPGRYVTFTKQELEALQPEATHTIDIEDFVRLEEIDPMYFEAPYYLLPEAGARRAYELLHRVMLDAGVVAVARVVLRTRERLVSIRPLEGGTLAMETMHFADELREAPELPEDTKAKGKGKAASSGVSDREIAMARTLVDELTTEFEPTRYHDTYREQVLEKIEQKASGQTIETPDVAEPSATPATDIMAALEASLAAARSKAKGSSGGGASSSKAKGAKGKGAAASAAGTATRGNAGGAKRATSTKARATTRAKATTKSKSKS